MVFKMFKLEFYVPRALEETQEVKKPITFYPQARAGEEITIKEFLEGLLKGEIRCLHEKFEIEDELRGERK